MFGNELKPSESGASDISEEVVPPHVKKKWLNETSFAGKPLKQTEAERIKQKN